MSKVFEFNVNLVPKLSGWGGYPSWKKQIENICWGEGIDKVVFGEEEKPCTGPDAIKNWEMSDRRGQVIILGTLDPQMKLHIIDKSTSNEMWRKFETKYGKFLLEQDQLDLNNAMEAKEKASIGCKAGRSGNSNVKNSTKNGNPKGKIGSVNDSDERKKRGKCFSDDTKETGKASSYTKNGKGRKADTDICKNFVFINSGSNVHSCGNREWFTSYEKFEVPQKLRIFSGVIKDCPGKGTVKVQALVGDKWEIIELHDVYHNPGCVNLFSWTAMMKEGFRVESDCERTTIFNRKDEEIFQGRPCVEGLHIMMFRPVEGLRKDMKIAVSKLRLSTEENAGLAYRCNLIPDSDKRK